MGYCNYTDIEKVMAQTLTTGSPSSALTGVPGKLTTVGKKFNLNLVTEDDADFYIQLASAQFDAAIGQQYVTPLHEVADMTMKLLADTNSDYTDTIILDRARNLVPGDNLYFIETNGDNKELGEVAEVDNSTNIVTLRTGLTYSYNLSETRVLRISFPVPVRYVTARIAAAAIYDRYAKAQSEPGKSEYGQIIMGEALQELNNIREGRTILYGATRRGWRFANPELISRYGVKGAFEQDSTRADPGNK